MPGSRRDEKRRKGSPRVIEVRLLTVKDAPRWLTGEPRKVWDGLVKLAGAGGLQWLRADALAVAAFCAQVAHLQEAEADITKNGMTLRTPPSRRRPDGAPYPNPALKMAQLFRRGVLDYAKTLGLTPESRRRLGWQCAPKVAPTEDPWEKLARG
jgi:P27 family predicted phage terminase small subunit